MAARRGPMAAQQQRRRPALAPPWKPPICSLILLAVVGAHCFTEEGAGNALNAGSSPALQMSGMEDEVGKYSQGRETPSRDNDEASGSSFVLDHSPPVISIDLDLPPMQRWVSIVPRFNASLHAAIAAFKADRVEYALLLSAADALLTRRRAADFLPPDELAELGSIAAVVAIPIGTLVALNGFYDLTASRKTSSRACTSVVAQSADGAVVHGRNLDYGLRAAMLNVTVVAEWRRNGRLLFTSVGFVGTVGFDTVLRHGGWSLSHDERDRGPLVANFIDLFLRHRVATFSMIRHVAEKAGTYTEAVAAVAAAQLDAPSYFVIAGTQPGEGAIITRSRDADAGVYALDAPLGRWYVLETNYDLWVPPAHGDDRRHPAARALADLGPGGVTSDGLLAVLSSRRCNHSAGERPVLNSETVYTTVMQPAKRGSGASTTILRTAQRSDECEAS